MVEVGPVRARDSGEEIENVKRLTDRRTDGRRTKSDQCLKSN